LLSLWAQGDPQERPEAATSLWLMQMGTVGIMGLIWVGTLFKDKTDGNTYSINRRRVQHGTSSTEAESLPQGTLLGMSRNYPNRPILMLGLVA